MQAAILGGWEITMIVLVVMFCVFVVPVAGIVAIVYLIANRGKTKPQPTPTAPLPAAAAAASPLKPMPVAKTEVLQRKCPQCGTALPPDAPEGLCPACLFKRGFATEAGGPAGQSAFVPPSVLELAQLFPQLEIQECLGRGGMGAVYKARQPRLDRLVALKILAPEKQTDPQFAERFEREARVLARLNHPNIVSVFDFGEVQGRYFLIMEFVDGLTLRQVMQRGKISPAEALQLVPKICEALQFAHEHGIVHRDIKPENILLDKEGRVKIADFGIAKIAGVEAKGLSLTGARDVMGTPNYMAPEQIEKPQTVDHRADIYSLGVVFYEMLTGELPLGKFAPPSQKVQMDVRLDEVVLHALEKEPERRYQQASQVKTAVETISGTPPPITPAPAPAAAAGLPISSAGVITAPAALLMVAGGWKMFSGFLNLLILSGVNMSLGSFLGLGSLLGIPLSVGIFSIVLFKIVPGCLIVFGGYQMVQRRNYTWAIIAGILAIVACSLIGFPAGIWALVVLARDDVKAAFGNGIAAPAATPAQPDHFWRRFTVVVACVILIPLTLYLTVIATAAFLVLNKPSAAPALTPLEMQKAGIRQEGGEFRKDSTQSFPLEANGRFDIDNVDGRIEIHGWNSNVVMLTAAIHGKTAESVNAFEFTVNTNSSRASVHTEHSPNFNAFQWNWASFKNMLGSRATVDYTVQVPTNAQLANVSSVDGSVVIEGVAGDITASTVDGGMQIKDASHDLKLTTVDGNITAEMNALGAGQSVSLNAVDGAISLAVPENADATFSVKTVDGSITSEFSSLQPDKDSTVGNNLNGRLGGGSASVNAHAVDGNIKFLKRPAREPARASAASSMPSALLAEAPVANGAAPTNSPPGAVAAIAAAQKWLALIDAGNYAGSWSEGAAIFQNGVTEPAWENSMNTFRKPLGALVSRQLQSSQSLTELPGAPDGQYVVMQFDTSFANKKAAVETVTFDLEKDGRWKSSGYFIK